MPPAGVPPPAGAAPVAVGLVGPAVAVSVVAVVVSAAGAWVGGGAAVTGAAAGTGAVGVVGAAVVTATSAEGEPAVSSPDASLSAAVAASPGLAVKYWIEPASGTINPRLTDSDWTRSLDTRAAAIVPRRVEISRFNTAACLPVLLAVALKLRASTFMATIPTRSVVRATIHRRPRVSR